VTDSESSSPVQPRPLQYAPPPPWHRRKKAKRFATLVGILTLLGVCALWAPRVVRFGKLTYWERRCLKYTTSPEQVCHESSIPGDPNVTFFSNSIPECWSKFYSLSNQAPLLSQGTVYLHEMRSKSKRRLVGVDVVVGLESGFSGESIRLVGHVFDPSSGILLPQQLNPFATDLPQAVYERSLKVWYGKADATQPDHVTIDLEIDGVKRTIDGWLQEDDTMKWEFRK